MENGLPKNTPVTSHETGPLKPEYSMESLMSEMEQERQEVIASTKKEIEDIESRDPKDSSLNRLKFYLERYESYETNRIGYFNEFSNNFHARLPGGLTRDTYSEATARRNVLFYEEQDKMLGEEKPPEYYEELLEKELKKVAEHSKFYQDFDRILTSFGLDPEEVGKWRTGYLEEGRGRNKTEEDKKYWYDILPRLYIELRKLGYKHYPDLVA